MHRQIVKKSLFVAIIIAFFLVNTIYFLNLITYQYGQSSKLTLLEEDSISDLNSQSTIYEGSLPPLNITEYGNLYNINQEIELSNREDYNISYYLDDVHDWKASKIEMKINNIQDTRNWINNSEFEPITIYRREQIIFQDSYTKNYEPGDETNVITEPGATFIRLHFVNSSFERYYDYLYVFNKSMEEPYLVLDGYREDFYSPWIPGDEIIITYESDLTTELHGYYIDYYEFINVSSNYYGNADSWGFNYESITNGKNYYGSGEIGNASGMWIGLYPELISSSEYRYDQGAYSELFQNLTIPRGKVQEAYFSFDYYIQNGLRTNENYLYFKINNKKVYSIGMRDIIEAGKDAWYSTGKIYMGLWVNKSNVFDSIINTQELNISVGIMSGDSVTYSYFEDGYQNIIWFDNISLYITTIANSTQTDINLNANGLTLDDISEWGSSSSSLTGGWDTNPIIINFNTSSPLLNFKLNTTIYGYHDTNSKVNQQNIDGISYNILPNGTIYWQFYHNFYMPANYINFEFTVHKPANWKIISVLDPTFLSIPFEEGEIGNLSVKISNEYAKYPGWWKFRATSPNYIKAENTIIAKNGEWGHNEFRSGDLAQIKTQVNNSYDIPLNLTQTKVNLTIYDPNNLVWYEHSSIPSMDGNLNFPEIHFTSENTTGGVYEYRFLWTNGTALGGYNSSFIVVHDSYLTLLEPNDAIFDNKTGAFVGELIPLRLYLRDSENNAPISGALVSYNWTSGTKYLIEGVSGIYETIINTIDLATFGAYDIIINSTKVGFSTSKLTLTINLGEHTRLQRLESDSKIEINSNSTIKFKYYSDFDEKGIEGAVITVNITNPNHYTVRELTDGQYIIQFSTSFLPGLGVYRLRFTFESIGYESQIYIYQFQIINPIDPSGEPNYLLIIGLILAIALSSFLGALSIRSYVYLPRKRRKQSELLSRTQRYKDMENIQAVVIIHKLSGIPLFSKSYSILEKQKKELFSGFIQAITTIGEEITGKKTEQEQDNIINKSESIERIIELDFKYFYCLICDRGELRIVLILKNKASERIKKQIVNFSLGLMLQITEQVENWDGSLDKFEQLIPPIMNNYFELYYKDPFTLNNVSYIAKIRDKTDMSKMQTRILNVIYSIAKNKREFYLEELLENIYEEDKNIVIDGIEALIQKKVIISLKN